MTSVSLSFLKESFFFPFFSSCRPLYLVGGTYGCASVGVTVRDSDSSDSVSISCSVQEHMPTRAREKVEKAEKVDISHVLGGLWSWGEGEWGRLGHNSLTSKWVPSLIRAALLGGLKVSTTKCLSVRCLEAFSHFYIFSVLFNR